MSARKNGHVVKRDGPDPIDREIGVRLRRFRQGRKLSLQALATEVDLSYQQLQRYEEGKNRVPASALYRLARSLKVPLGMIFNVDEDPALALYAEAIGRVPEPVRGHMCAVIEAVHALDQGRSNR